MEHRPLTPDEIARLRASVAVLDADVAKLRRATATAIEAARLYLAQAERLGNLTGALTAKTVLLQQIIDRLPPIAVAGGVIIPFAPRSSGADATAAFKTDSGALPAVDDDLFTDGGAR